MTEEKEKVCGAIEKDFQFWMPLDVIKAPGGEMRVGGIATDEQSPDIQGEKVFVDGLDISYLKSRGAFNWNHQKGPGDIIGEVDIAQKQGGKLYVEGPLYPHVEQAKHVWNLIRSMQDVKSDRKLGLSIEGKIKERDVANQKLIKKAWIKNVAITYNPINQGTYVDMIKSLGDFQFSPCDGDCAKCALCECPPEVKKADLPDPLNYVGVAGQGITKEAAENQLPQGDDGRANVSESRDVCTKSGKPKTECDCETCRPPAPPMSMPQPTEKAISAGHDIPATTGGVSGSAVRNEDLEKEKKTTTYTKKDIDKCEEDKKKKKNMTKAELAGWFVEKGYNVNEAAALAHLIFMSADMELEKSRVKMHQRVRRGHVEWVKEHERRLSKEDRAYKQTLTSAMERWHKEGSARPFAEWLRSTDRKTYNKLVEGIGKRKTSHQGYAMHPDQKRDIVRDFADILGLPAKIKLTEKDYPLGKPDVDSPAQVMHEHILARQGKTFKMEGDVPSMHQMNIAKKTLRMPNAMVGVMGGMNKKEARKILDLAPDGSQDYMIDHFSRRKGHKVGKKPIFVSTKPDRIVSVREKTFKMTGEYDPDLDVKRNIERKHDKMREYDTREMAGSGSPDPYDEAPGWDEKDIYSEMKEAGVQIDSHESDLYVPVTPKTKAIVDAYSSKENVTTFRNQQDGKQWYDIPFAYAPFWDKKQGRKGFLEGVGKKTFRMTGDQALAQILGKTPGDPTGLKAEVKARAEAGKKAGGESIGGVSVKKIVSGSFPDYKGRKVSVYTDRIPKHLDSYWDEGHRSYYVFYELGTGRIRGVGSNHPMFEADKPRYLEKLPEGVALVQRVYSGASPQSIRVYANPSDLTATTHPSGALDEALKNFRARE